MEFLYFLGNLVLLFFGVVISVVTEAHSAWLAVILLELSGVELILTYNWASLFISDGHRGYDGARRSVLTKVVLPLGVLVLNGWILAATESTHTTTTASAWITVLPMIFATPATLIYAFNALFEWPRMLEQQRNYMASFEAYAAQENHVVHLPDRDTVYGTDVFDDTGYY